MHKDTRKVKVLSLPQTIKEKSTFRAKALRRELVVTTNSRRRTFARNVDFSFIVSGSERTFTFRVSLNTLPTLATLVRDISIKIRLSFHQVWKRFLHLILVKKDLKQLCTWSVSLVNRELKQATFLPTRTSA